MIRESNLLLVEDDMAVRQSLTRVLATENYQVFGASTCREAILLCTQNQIDVVLLDLNLDPEDGWEVFHQLRELRPDLPIFVTSGQPQRAFGQGRVLQRTAVLMGAPIGQQRPLQRAVQRIVSEAPGRSPTASMSAARFF